MILNERFLKNEVIKNGNYSKTSEFLEKRKFDINKDYDLFISHSFLDKELVETLYRKFEEAGYEVYIDWKEKGLEDRENVSAETARVLKRRMNSCLGLSYIATANIVNSKWCPWELGYADGKKNRAAILPVLKDSGKEYKGLEYLGIYPYIDYEITKGGKYEFWVNDVKDKSKYSTLREWLRTGKLEEHSIN